MFWLNLRHFDTKIGIFSGKKRTISGNSDNLVWFWNRTKSGTTLFKTALSGDSQYYVSYHHFEKLQGSMKHRVIGRRKTFKNQIVRYGTEWSVDSEPSKYVHAVWVIRNTVIRNNFATSWNFGKNKKPPPIFFKNLRNAISSPQVQFFLLRNKGETTITKFQYTLEEFK